MTTSFLVVDGRGYIWFEGVFVFVCLGCRECCVGVGFGGLRSEAVTFESVDGVRLDGLLYVPDRVPASAVVVCHGFDRRGFRGIGLFEQMAKAACVDGFVSLVFDFRGCGRSGGAFGYGWDEQRDLEAAVEFLLSRPETRKEGGVYVVGHSLGGAVALYTAEGDKRVKGVALWAVPHDHAYNIRRFNIRSRGLLQWYLFLLISYVDVVVPVSRFWTLRVWGFRLRPRDVRQRLMRIREVDVLKRLEGLPVLFVNGSGDVLSGLEEAKLNYEAAKGPKELVVVESLISPPRGSEEAIANHVFRGKEDEVIGKTLLWLRALDRM
jgi:pimeloyl-ACP methyl ester carboxylesterase